MLQKFTVTYTHGKFQFYSFVHSKEISLLRAVSCFHCRNSRTVRYWVLSSIARHPSQWRIQVGAQGARAPPFRSAKILASPRIYAYGSHAKTGAGSYTRVRVYYCEPWRAQAASCHQLLFSCTKAQSSRRTLRFG